MKDKVESEGRAVMRSGRNVFEEYYYIEHANNRTDLIYITCMYVVVALTQRNGYRTSKDDTACGITSFTIFLRPSTPSVCYFYALSTVKFRSIDLPRY